MQLIAPATTKVNIYRKTNGQLSNIVKSKKSFRLPEWKKEEGVAARATAAAAPVPSKEKAASKETEPSNIASGRAVSNSLENKGL